MKSRLSGPLSQPRAGNHDYQVFILLPIERQSAKQERAPLENSPGNPSALWADDAGASLSTSPPGRGTTPSLQQKRLCTVRDPRKISEALCFLLCLL